MHELEVFYGELTPVRAVIYARLPRPAGATNLTLSGTIRGPRCLHAQTLPATWPLVDLGPGPTVLAQATVTEPCFWSPDLPNIYDVTVQLERGGQIMATQRREIGFRPLGARGRQLIMAGKNWVLRGVCTTSTTARLPRQWHDASASFVTEQPDDELLSEASQWGALGVVFVNLSGDDAIERLRALARHPGAAIAVIRGNVPPDLKKPAALSNLLFAAEMGPEAAAVSPWANVLLVQADEMAHFEKIAAETQMPTIAMRPLRTPTDIATARADCDALQRDMAPLGQFAGYIV